MKSAISMISLLSVAFIVLVDARRGRNALTADPCEATQERLPPKCHQEKEICVPTSSTSAACCPARALSRDSANVCGVTGSSGKITFRNRSYYNLTRDCRPELKLPANPWCLFGCESKECSQASTADEDPVLIVEGH